MPLVVFNFYHDDIQHDVNNVPAGQNFVKHTRTVNIPRHAMQSKWTLEAVNANFNEDQITDWITLDVELPELMTTQNILYSNVAVGTVAKPLGGAFRFYTKLRQLSSVGISGGTNLHREPSSYGVVSEYPKWVLGDMKLETPTLTCSVTPRKGNVGDTHNTIQLNGVSIILSYEE